MRIALAKVLLRLAFRLVAIKVYEPVEIGGRRVRHNRETDNRWTAIEAVLKVHNVRNILDIGCAEGWLVRRAASDLGCFALGMEASDAVLPGELARLHDGVERAATIKARLTSDDIRTLPCFDAVLCLSVVHHLVRKQGLDAPRILFEHWPHVPKRWWCSKWGPRRRAAGSHGPENCRKCRWARMCL